MVPCLNIKVLSHLELRLVWGCVLSFNDLRMAVQLFNTTAEETIFFPLYILLLGWIFIVHRWVGLFLGSLILFHCPYVYLCVNTTMFWLLQLCRIAWNLKGSCFLFCSFFLVTAFGNLSLSWFHINLNLFILVLWKISWIFCYILH